MPETMVCWVSVRSGYGIPAMSDLAIQDTGAATVLVRNGKTDAEGRGDVLYLVRDSMALVQEWLVRSGVSQGRLFRSLRRGELGEALDPSQIPRIYQGDGKACRARGGGGRPPLRAQHPRGCGPGHDRLRRRAASDPSGRAVEEHGHGEPLRRAAARTAKRRGAAGPDAVAGMICGMTAPAAPPVGNRRREGARDLPMRTRQGRTHR